MVNGVLGLRFGLCFLRVHLTGPGPGPGSLRSPATDPKNSRSVTKHDWMGTGSPSNVHSGELEIYSREVEDLLQDLWYRASSKRVSNLFEDTCAKNQRIN